MRRPTTRLVIAATMLLPFIAGAPASAGPSGGALPPVLIEQIRVADLYGIPADAAMVAANVTAVGPAEAGHITVFPCDEDVPATSNINYVADAVAPNLTLTRISAWGTICVSTFAVSDVIVDVVGYVPAGSDITALPNPVRFLDSRDDSPEPLAAGSTTEIPIAGVSGVAADADVVMFNLTAIGADQPGHLTAFPCREPLPETSSVNYAPGQVVPNLITSRIGDDGSVCVHTIAPAEIIVDVAAYATSGITPLPNPVRMIDTRTTNTPITAGGVLTLDIDARPEVPSTATAAVYNLTSVGSTAAGFATSYPCDIGLPLVSNLNYGAGQVTANGTITKLSANGELCIYTLAQTHLIVDLIGYTEGTTDYVPLTPERIWDSREGWQPTCDWVVMPATDPESFRLSRVVVFNVATLETNIVDLPEDHRFLPADSDWHPVVNPTCDGVVYRAEDFLYEYVFGEVWSAQAIPVDREDGDVVALNVPGALESLDDGRIVQVHDAVTDLATGQEIGPGHASVIDVDGQSWYRTDISIGDDGIVRAAIYHDGTASRSIVRTTSATGELIASWPMELDPVSIDVSPDSRYVVVNTRPPGVPDPDFPGVTWILTVFGDVVDVFYGYDIHPDAGFIGPGVLAACVGGIGLFRLELFGRAELLAGVASPLWQRRPHCFLGT